MKMVIITIIIDITTVIIFSRRERLHLVLAMKLEALHSCIFCENNFANIFHCGLSHFGSPVSLLIFIRFDSSL